MKGSFPDARIKGPVFGSSNDALERLNKKTNSSVNIAEGDMRGNSSRKIDHVGTGGVGGGGAYFPPSTTSNRGGSVDGEGLVNNESSDVISYPLAVKEATKAVNSLSKTVFSSISKPFVDGFKCGSSSELYMSISKLRQGIDLLIRERKQADENAKITAFQYKMAADGDALSIAKLKEEIDILVRKVESLHSQNEVLSNEAKFDRQHLQHELTKLKEKNTELTSDLIVANRTISEQISSLLEVPRVEEGYLNAAKKIVQKREQALIEKTKTLRKIQTDVVSLEYWRNLCNGKQDEIMELENKVKYLEKHNLSILRMYHNLVEGTNRKDKTGPSLGLSSPARPVSAKALNPRVNVEVTNNNNSNNSNNSNNNDNNNNNNNNNNSNIKSATRPPSPSAKVKSQGEEKASKDILKLIQKQKILERKVVELSRQLARARASPLLTSYDPFEDAPQQGDDKVKDLVELESTRLRGKSLLEMRAQVEKEVDWRSIIRDYMKDESDEEDDDNPPLDANNYNNNSNNNDNNNNYDSKFDDEDMQEGKERERVFGTVDNVILDERERSKVAERVQRSYRDRILQSRASLTWEHQQIRKSKCFAK